MKHDIFEGYQVKGGINRNAPLNPRPAIAPIGQGVPKNKILELERWDGQQSTLVYWINKTLDKVNECVHAINKDSAKC